MEWDAFISHATEDKETLARPLAEALSRLGCKIWYDEFSMTIGESLSRSIDRGLAQSRWGIVVVSQAFITKPWPEYELRGLVTREISGRESVILPLWHGVTYEEIVKFSPSLADKVAAVTAGKTAGDVALQILQKIRPDIYERTPREKLKALADGATFRKLEAELAAAKERLAEFQCPTCKSMLVEVAQIPLDPEEDHWDEIKSYECGYRDIAGQMERPCPADPQYPQLRDYDIRCVDDGKLPYFQWTCTAFPMTEMARKLRLPDGRGSSEDEARRRLEDAYYERAHPWRRPLGVSVSDQDSF